MVMKGTAKEVAEWIKLPSGSMKCEDILISHRINSFARTLLHGVS
jgi:hypothetical protein